MILLYLLLGVGIFGFTLRDGRWSRQSDVLATLLLMAFLTLLVFQGALSEYGVSDRGVYLDLFVQLSSASSPFAVDSDADPLFLATLWALGQLGNPSPELLFGFTTLVLSVSYYVACRAFLTGWAAVLSLLTLCAVGLLEAYSVVALRQGLAISAVMLTLFAFRGKGLRWPLLLAFCGAAVLFHWSAIGPVLVVLLVRYRLFRLRLAVGVWCVLAIAYVSSLQARLFAGLSTWLPQMEEYSSSGAYANYGSEGNRFAFLAVSGAALALFLWALRAEGFSPTSDTEFRQLVELYVGFNCFFLALGFIAFSDRIAAYSWFLAPLLFWLCVERARWSLVAMLTTPLVLIAILVQDRLPQVLG